MADDYARWLQQEEAIRKMLKPFEDTQRYANRFEETYERLGNNSTVRKALEQEDARRKRLTELGTLAEVGGAARAFTEAHERLGINSTVQKVLAKEEARRKSLAELGVLLR